MSSLENRIEKLEKHTGAIKSQAVIWVLYDGQPEPTEAQREAAIERYKGQHPDWQDQAIMVLYPQDLEAPGDAPRSGIHETDKIIEVVDQETRQALGDFLTYGVRETDTVIEVISKKARDLTLQITNGEGTE